jgi:hypothetical protein
MKPGEAAHHALVVIKIGNFTCKIFQTALSEEIIYTGIWFQPRQNINERFCYLKSLVR